MMNQFIVSNHGAYGWLCVRAEDSGIPAYYGVKRLW